MPPSTLRDGTEVLHLRGQPTPTRLPASADFRRPGHSQKSALGEPRGRKKAASEARPFVWQRWPTHRLPLCTVTTKQVHRNPKQRGSTCRRLPSLFWQVRVQEELRGLV